MAAGRYLPFKKTKSHLAVKVTVVIAAAIALVSALSALMIYNMGFNALKHEIRDNLIMLAANSAVSIDAEKLRTVLETRSESSPEYQELQKQLQGIMEESGGKLRYVYTLAEADEKIIFVVDATPAEDMENHSKTGDVFNSEKYPVVFEGFKKPTAESEPIQDYEFGGIIQTGYAPIRDSQGTVVGVMALDMDVSVIHERQAAMHRAGSLTILAAILMAVLLGILLSRYITSPLISLKRSIEGFTKGEYDIRADIKRNDELGELAEAYNKMIFDLRVSRERLEKSRSELEEKVAVRTSELSEMNRDIREILDNISFAVFTVDHDLKVNNRYSGNAVDIFGDVYSADRDLLDVLFPSMEKASERSSMSSWIDKAFDSSIAKWNDIEAIQPVRETVITGSDGYGNVTAKYIRIFFQPLQVSSNSSLNERITKLMVYVQDITSEKEYSGILEMKSKDYKYDISEIIRKIKADMELFEDFMNECREYLFSFEPKLASLRDDKGDMDIINDLFRIVHTIKGNARIFSLSRIEGKAYEMENIFAAVRKGETELTDELIEGIFKNLDEFNHLFDELNMVYNSILNDDMNKKDNIARQADIGTIKVKIQEINSLGEIISKADTMLNLGISNGLLVNIDKDKVEELQSLFCESKKKLRSIRKVTVANLFINVPRMIREVSSELGKKARFVLKGGDAEIDKAIFDKLGDPLVHIIRNSIDHGIEKPEDRERNGKLTVGTIEVIIENRDSELCITIMDDGQGLDLDKIKANAVKRGLISPETAVGINDDEALRLIFLPGLTTKVSADDISGRGVGLDIVRTVVEDNLNGEISLENYVGSGFKMMLRIPVSSLV